MRTSLLFAAILAATPSLEAQTTVVDEGSFTLSVNGNRVGREQFSIKRNVVPGVTTMSSRATLTMTLDGRRVESRLQTDTSGLPIEFSRDEYLGGRIISRVSAGAGSGRFAERVTTDGGESKKEVRLPAGTVLGDAELIHPYYFYFAARQPGARVPIVDPRALRRDSVAIAVVDASTEVEVGNGNVPARHLTVTDTAGSVTDVWLDARGRLLRIAVRSRGFVATRDEPPG